MTGDGTVAFARFGAFGKKVRAAKPGDYLKMQEKKFAPGDTTKKMLWSPV